MGWGVEACPRAAQPALGPVASGALPPASHALAEAARSGEAAPRGVRTPQAIPQPPEEISLLQHNPPWAFAGSSVRRLGLPANGHEALRYNVAFQRFGALSACHASHNRAVRLACFKKQSRSDHRPYPITAVHFALFLQSGKTSGGFKAECGNSSFQFRVSDCASPVGVQSRRIATSAQFADHTARLSASRPARLGVPLSAPNTYLSAIVACNRR